MESQGERKRNCINKERKEKENTGKPPKKVRVFNGSKSGVHVMSTL